MTKTVEFILSGPKLDVDDADELLGDLLFRSLKKLPQDKIFQIIVKPYDIVTVGEFFKLCAQICEGFIKEGLKKGDIVMLAGDNSTQLHASFIGAIWAGGIPNPVSENISVVELKNLLEKIKAKWMLCEPQALSSVSKVVEIMKTGAKIIVLNSTGVSRPGCTSLEKILPNIDLKNFAPKSDGNVNDTAIIFCSSGTTGVPKGVATSHISFLRDIVKWQFIPQLNFMKPQVVTSFFSWVTGVCYLMFGCIHGCDRVVTTSNDPEELLQTIEKYKVHGILLPPSQIKYILDCPNFDKYDVSSLREVYTGGSILGKATIEKFVEKWKSARLYGIYGMTETGLITMPAPNQPIDSVGYPFYNKKIKIVDPDSGETLGQGERGEILVKSESDGFFTEYIGNEEATRESFVDGWLRTGDLGYIDEAGNLYVYARIKELLKCENTQISPSEIEMFILTIPGVSDVGVAGIATGEDSFILMALVVKSPGTSITAQEIKDKVAENFSEKKHLKAGVYFINECPRSVSRKIRRNKLNEMAIEIYKKAQSSSALAK